MKAAEEEVAATKAAEEAAAAAKAAEAAAAKATEAAASKAAAEEAAKTAEEATVAKSAEEAWAAAATEAAAVAQAQEEAVAAKAAAEVAARIAEEEAEAAKAAEEEAARIAEKESVRTPVKSNVGKLKKGAWEAQTVSHIQAAIGAGRRTPAVDGDKPHSPLVHRMGGATLSRQGSTASEAAQDGEVVSAFKNEREMIGFLTKHGIDAASWSVTPGAKSAHQLYTELVDRECMLRLINGRVMRCLSVAKVRVQRPGSDDYLVETYQKFTWKPKDPGRVRNNILLSEKISPGERPAEAAVRGVLEELKPYVVSEDDLSVLGLLHETLETTPSPSYPALMSRYTLHEVGIQVRGLPDAEFETVEVKEKGDLIHSWKWRQALIQPEADLELTAAQLRLLEGLFPDSSRVAVTKMHGGYSGSLVLRTVPYDSEERPQDPCITKIDRAKAVENEVRI